MIHRAGRTRWMAVGLLAALAWLPQVVAQEPAWFCPMHPDVTASEAGRCRRCGMALLLGRPFDTREYGVDVTTAPAAVRAGEPFTATLTVTHPEAGTAIPAFETVHDKRFHLFVISHDMTEFQHVHPDPGPNSTWSMALTLPKPGYYRLLADFVPAGGSPQFIGRTLVTAGYDGDLASAAARLGPDALTRTEGALTARLTLDPPTLIAGQYGHITYTLSDANSGAPVTDLEPYLGAFGHTLILSDDLVDYVHSHPTEGPESDISRGLGGPTVTFEGYMPRPGLYRAWTQFQRGGVVTTMPFTFTVKSLDEAMREQRSASR